MLLTLDAILYKLRDLSPEIMSENVNRRLFSGVKHIAYCSASASGNHLFVGFLSEVLATRENDDRVFLCVSDLKNSRTAAASSGRNIVLFPAQHHMEYLFDRVLDVFEEIKDWDKALHVGSLEGKGLDYLVQISESQIANPMLILDTSFNLLEHTRTIPIEYHFFQETVQNGYSPSFAINHLTDTGLFKQLRSSDLPIIHQAAASDTETNIYFKLSYGGLELGFAVVSCGKQSPDPGYVDLLELFFENINLYFRQYFYPKKAGNYMYESFLQNLMADDSIALQQVEVQSNYVKDIKASGIYRLFRLHFPGKVSLPLSFLARELSMAIPYLKPFLYEGSIYVLREYPNEPAAEHGDIESDLSAIEAVLSKPNMIIASSGVFSSITTLSTAKSQCAAALRLSNQSSRCLRYEDYCFAHLLEAASSSVPLESFLSSRYLRLQQYDEENGTDLCPLLECHLSTLMRVSDTARALFLHRNTVLTRLKKIEELLEAELSDKSVHDELMLSFQVASYLKKSI